MAYRSVAHCIGWLVAILAAAMLLPAAAAAVARDSLLAWNFAMSAILTGFVGTGIVLASRTRGLPFGKREAYMFIVLSWFALPFAGAVPFWFGGLPGGPVDSLFEAASGVTTTGASIVASPQDLAPSILLWRGMLQWFGGFYTIILFIVALSHLRVGGMQMFRSALPRGESENLPLRMLLTARDLFWVYAGLTLACAVLLWITGVPTLDGICLAFSALSTGGFMPRSDGTAAYAGIWTEATLILFMLLGALNFTVNWAVLTARFSPIRRDPETIDFIAVCAIAVLVVVLLSLLSFREIDQERLWQSLFLTVSALTTTGFQSEPTASFGLLPPVLLIGLMLIGGCTGSSAGGMKILRIVVLFKQARRELHRLSHPHGVIPLKLGSTPISEAAVWGVWSLFFFLVLAIAGGSLLLAAAGLPPMAAVAATSAALSNAGPLAMAIDAEVPAYHLLSDGAKFVLMVLMLLGRLELVALLMLLNPSYWRD